MSWLTILGCDRNSGKALPGLDHVRQSIADILFTPEGSRLCNRNYGSGLPDLIDRPLNDAGVQQVYAATALALARHYPQLRLSTITLESPDQGRLHIRLTGSIAGRDEPVSLDFALNPPSPPAALQAA